MRAALGAPERWGTTKTSNFGSLPLLDGISADESSAEGWGLRRNSHQEKKPTRFYFSRKAAPGTAEQLLQKPFPAQLSSSQALRTSLVAFGGPSPSQRTPRKERGAPPAPISPFPANSASSRGNYKPLKLYQLPGS